MRVLIRSFGCSTNLADGEVLAGCLRNAGFDLVQSLQDADIVIFNTCAVKEPTENKVIEALKRVPPSKQLIVTGCLPAVNYRRLKREVTFDAAVGPAAGKDIVKIVQRVIGGDKILLTAGSTKSMPSLALRRIPLNPVISIVPISYGCLGSCSYCCVRFARGYLRSHTVGEIVQRIEADITCGVREFWLASQDSGCYGRDIGSNLHLLLDSVTLAKGDYRVRVGMMTANSALEIIEKLLVSMDNPRTFKFLHLPVQSGDDRVLKKMNRFYSVNDFTDLLRLVRNSFPDISLSTDVICGFPGEDVEAFERTLSLIENEKPDVVNVSKFFARPGTLAAKMKDHIVSASEIKRRSAAMARLAKSVGFDRNMHWVGWEGEVLVDERGKVAGSWIGRNFAYKPIVVKSEERLLGQFVSVRVEEALPTYLLGRLI